MTCSDVRKALAGLALGDLDAEPAAEVAAHVSSCAACRAEEEALGRTVTLLRRTAPVAPSTERRSAAVAAMAGAHADQSEKLLVRRPGSWTALAAAAAFLVVLGAALLMRGGGPTFTVTRITGGAKHRDAGSWYPVLGGMTLSVGDRIVTDPGCRMRLVSGDVELFLDEGTALEIVAPRRMTLESGRVLAVSPASNLMVIADMANNAARVAGRVELSLREVKGSVGGSLEVKGAQPVVPEPSTQVKRLLVAQVQQGEVVLDGDRDQRLRASAGQQWTFNFSGPPVTAPLKEAAVGRWADALIEGR